MVDFPTPALLCSLLEAEVLRCDAPSWEQPLGGIVTDSRRLSAGEGFVALRGDRFDGHQFISAAVAAGAAIALVDQAFELPEALLQSSGCSILQVPDSLAAYQHIARHWRRQFPHPIVAVTGSVGKTTMKEMIAAMLATQGPVLKTEANFNNEIGLPKTLLGLGPDHRYGVVEMGMRGLGEIALLAQIAEPDVAVITNVGTAHIERLGSELAIAQAKCELLAELKPDGIAVLNGDRAAGNGLLRETASRIWSGKTITFGLDPAPGQLDVRGQLIDGGSLEVEGQRFRLPLPGRHNALNFCGALAVARALGIDWSLLTDLTLNLPAGRAQRHALPNNILLLDETYNAGAESMGAALGLLAETQAQRRIAVLGTMLELGEHSIRLHRQVGEAVAQTGVDLLVTLAAPAEAAALAAGAAGVPVQAFDRPEPLVDYLQKVGQPGDCILFKASRGVALDRVVAQLQRHWSA